MARQNEANEIGFRKREMVKENTVRESHRERKTERARQAGRE